MTGHSPAKWPTWLIAIVGGLLTIAMLAWLGSTYDSRGEPLLDDTLGKIIVAGIGGVVTIGTVFAQRALSRTVHELRPNHGSSLADGVNRIEAIVGELKHTQHQQAEAIARLDSVPAEIAGVRRDLGRQATTDQQTHDDIAQLRKEFATHVDWSQKQADRIDGLEKEKP